MSQALRDDPQKFTLAPATAAERFSSNTATWLFIRDPKQLTAEKQAELELICQRSETARKTYALTQQFLSMLRLRRGQDFETWLSAVEASHIAELGRFAHSLCKDKDAVIAGLTLSYSNGPVEAQVHKLKLVKRSMDAACQTSSVTTTSAPYSLIGTKYLRQITFICCLRAYFSSRITSRQFKRVW